jgi:hypothetical protein
VLLSEDEKTEQRSLFDNGQRGDWIMGVEWETVKAMTVKRWQYIHLEAVKDF